MQNSILQDPVSCKYEFKVSSFGDTGEEELPRFSFSRM